MKMSLEKKWGVWLLIVGGINWGLVGLGYFLNSDLNIINLLLGSWPTLEYLVYLVVGVCAVWLAYLEIQKR